MSRTLPGTLSPTTARGLACVRWLGDPAGITAWITVLPHQGDARYLAVLEGAHPTSWSLIRWHLPSDIPLWGPARPLTLGELASLLAPMANALGDFLMRLDDPTRYSDDLPRRRDVPEAVLEQLPVTLALARQAPDAARVLDALVAALQRRDWEAARRLRDSPAWRALEDDP